MLAKPKALTVAEVLINKRGSHYENVFHQPDTIVVLKVINVTLRRPVLVHQVIK